MKTNRKKSKTVRPGGVAEYIAARPKDAQIQLRAMRAVIREVAPDAIETVSYFDMPGYSYEGFDYNGMFAWFSFKAPFARLHVRPQAIIKYKGELERQVKTKAVVSFPLDKPISKSLVRKLVRASLKDMRDAAKKKCGRF